MCSYKVSKFKLFCLPYQLRLFCTKLFVLHIHAQITTGYGDQSMTGLLPVQCNQVFVCLGSRGFAAWQQLICKHGLLIISPALGLAHSDGRLKCKQPQTHTTATGIAHQLHCLMLVLSKDTVHFGCFARLTILVADSAQASCWQVLL